MPGEGEYEPLADRPLFGNGEAQPRGRVVNTMIVVVTTLLVFFTAISAFVSTAVGRNLFFVVCIVLFCISHITVIVWYRQGDLDPKFKKLIYFNTLCIVLTCICAAFLREEQQSDASSFHTAASVKDMHQRLYTCSNNRPKNKSYDGLL